MSSREVDRNWLSHRRLRKGKVWLPLRFTIVDPLTYFNILKIIHINKKNLLKMLSTSILSARLEGLIGKYTYLLLISVRFEQTFVWGWLSHYFDASRYLWSMSGHWQKPKYIL